MYEITSPESPRGARCGVCGFAEMRTDLVFDRGLLYLRECPRCLHRDTRREPGFPVGPKVASLPAPRQVA